MSDDLIEPINANKRHIDVGQASEVQAWALRFGVSSEEIRNAVDSVGSEVPAVARFLKSAAPDLNY